MEEDFQNSLQEEEMKIINLSDSCEKDTRSISMDLVWEDSDRPEQRLYFSADGVAAELMRPSADAFAIACLPLALVTGEKRILIEGSLCTRLRSGLNALNRVFSDWYSDIVPVRIEPQLGFTPTSPPSHRRVASLLSGGVDGLSTLRQNRLDYPLDHPESIRACITLFGINTYDVADTGPVPERLAAFQDVIDRLKRLSEVEKFQLLPVRTNIRSLGLDYKRWTQMGFGPGHVAVTQLFQGVFDKVLVSSDGAGPNPAPSAIHPLINHWFSTAAVTIQGDQDELLRSDKVALLADWEQGRTLMQPCHYVTIPEDGKINCGRCEKCVRTMLLLTGLGRLDEVDAFDDKEVTPGMVRRIPVHNDAKADLLQQALPLLKEAGRHDLVWAIRKRLWRFQLNKKFKA